jgi:uncharacterized membrane protein YhaH (DUF805 family)
MKFTDAIKTCLSKYFTFSGRAGRPEFWWFFLFIFLGNFVLSILDLLIFGIDPITQQANSPLASLFSLLTFFPLLAAAWRRMHDTGRSGCLLLLPLAVPVFGMLLLLTGLTTVSTIEGAGQAGGTVQEVTLMLGSTGAVILMLAHLAIVILLLWWLTRRSEAGTNRFGALPPAIGTPATT